MSPVYTPLRGEGLGRGFKPRLWVTGAAFLRLYAEGQMFRPFLYRYPHVNVQRYRTTPGYFSPRLPMSKPYLR